MDSVNWRFIITFVNLFVMFYVSLEVYPLFCFVCANLLQICLRPSTKRGVEHLKSLSGLLRLHLRPPTLQSLQLHNQLSRHHLAGGRMGAVSHRLFLLW